MEFEFEWNFISNVLFLKGILFHFFYFIFIVQMEGDEPATTSHKGEKISSYTISFKLEVVEFAENKSITAAALKYKVDRHSIRDWKKKKNELQELSKSVSNKKRKRLQGGGTKTLSEEMEERILEWIVERRSKMLRGSRKLTRKKAIVVYGDLKRIDPDRYDEKFGSHQWMAYLIYETT